MRAFRLAFAPLLLVALTACTYGNHPWRLTQKDKVWLPVVTTEKVFDVAAAVASNETAPTWEPFPTYDLGIIEFKDDGTLWSPAQKELVVGKIREIAKSGATIVVYAHGWHHNAKVDDPNIVSFRNVLATIAAQQHVGMTCGDKNSAKNRSGRRLHRVARRIIDESGPDVVHDLGSQAHRTPDWRPLDSNGETPEWRRRATGSAARNR